jgi:hypothetical protein
MSKADFDALVKTLEDKNKSTKERYTSLTDQQALIKSMDAVQSAVVKSVTILVTSLLQDTLKTSITNFPERQDSISTPDALEAGNEVKQAINELKVCVEGIGIDLDPITSRLEALERALSKLPTEYPSFPEMPTEMAVNNLQSITDKLNELKDAFNSKEYSPKIKVDVPKIDAPNVSITVEKDLKPLLKAVEAIKIPDNDKKLLELKKEMSKVTKAIESIVFPVPNFRTKDIVDAIENIQIELAPIYDIRNIEEDVTYKYFGFEERGGTNWRIMRKTLATSVFMYATGTTDYATAWTNKASEVYA